MKYDIREHTIEHRAKQQLVLTKIIQNSIKQARKITKQKPQPQPPSIMLNPFQVKTPRKIKSFTPISEKSKNPRKWRNLEKTEIKRCSWE
jgi:hypothetical protein